MRGLQLTNADLTSAKLENADFSDSDLRFAKFSRADLRGVDFSGANLRGAVFAGANLGDVGDNDAWFEGADLTGALFSGSAVARERAQTWHPSACPDGRAPSSYEGCEGRLGAVDPEFQQAFELVSGGPRSTGCGVPGSLKRALAASSTSFLFFQRRNWVRLQDGSFMSGHARFEQSRDLGEGAWTVRTDACGTQVFREVTSAP